MAAEEEVVESITSFSPFSITPFLLLSPPLLASLEASKTSSEVPILLEFTLTISMSHLEEFYLLFYLLTQLSWVSFIYHLLHRVFLLSLVRIKG
jgi:hypothetical protein